MKKLMVAGVLLAGVFAFTASAQAHGLRKGKGCGGCESDCAQPCAQPAPPPPPQYVDKVVTCYKTEWREKEVESIVNRMVSHEEVRKNSYTVCVPVWTEEKRSVTEYKSVPKVVEREVVVCKKVPVEAPCGDCGGCDSGCGHHKHKLFGRRHHGGGDCGGGCETPCNVVQEVQKVKCTVYECVPVKRDITVKVCHYEQQQKVSETKCVVWECKPEKVMRKVRYCERVPYQTTIKVPVAAPCASTCNTGCDSGCGRHHRGGRLHRHGGEGCCG